jgi:hypothetical protein
MATAFCGVFRAGGGGHHLWVDEWPGFEAKWRDLSARGFRLTSLAVSADEGTPRFAGAFREGGGGHHLWVSPWASFEARWRDLSGQGFRLVSLATYVHQGQPHFAGVFREGSDGHHLWVDRWSGFEAKWAALSAQGFRLKSLSTYVLNGEPHYAGVFREGGGGHALWVAPWASFEAKWKELSAQGLRLISLDSFAAGGTRTFAGVFGPGADGYHLWVGADWESFTGKWNTLSNEGFRLVDMAMYRHPCTSDCLNQVVMPTGSYNYHITRTATHCPGLPGTCGTPAAGSSVVYRWPADVVGSSRFVRHSALQFDAQFLTLPFSDTAVNRNGIWRYGDGGWHHAGDYSRSDVDTFEVRAAAPGRVVHVGYDTWSGNTVIVSHDVGGVADAFRTIYMHLRNGSANDCAAAWDLSIPTLSGTELTDYTTHLTSTGCPKQPPRNPDAAHWGTNQQTIAVTVNQQVARGDFLAWAGNTGPGGKRGGGGPNTHLHIFFCRRDPTNNAWYFFDPYGLYAKPDCYAAGVTAATTGPCVRYPVAWRGGRPQYP